MTQKLESSKIAKHVNKITHLLHKLKTERIRLSPKKQDELNGRLLEAAKQGRIARIERLLKVGANVNAKDKEDRTALMWAASEGRTKSCRILIDNGADKDLRDKNKWNAVMHAKANRKYTTAEHLIKAGARDFSSAHKF
ncbi:MAG: ankyrin repeat domain-containing protein [Candidatus Micrarchaeota archaeon]|nr:ankyrin repeat domain-containing protein [Candidatus Micrarchaeota archaeon]